MVHPNVFDIVFVICWGLNVARLVGNGRAGLARGEAGGSRPAPCGFRRSVARHRAPGVSRLVSDGQGTMLLLGGHGRGQVFHSQNSDFFEIRRGECPEKCFWEVHVKVSPMWLDACVCMRNADTGAGVPRGATVRTECNWAKSSHAGAQPASFVVIVCLSLSLSLSLSLLAPSCSPCILFAAQVFCKFARRAVAASGQGPGRGHSAGTLGKAKVSNGILFL